MKILALDTFSGISGDMMLGLLVDLGVELGAIEAGLRALPVASYRLSVNREARQGITGSRVQVDIDEQHHHRTWADIDAMLADSTLAEPVKARARAIFRRVGVAEAAVHGVPLETVHFHEVGAVDSIVDIVGAAIGLELLGVDRIFCTPLPLSHGSIACAHGTLPLPAPATLEILKGLPVVDGHCDKELVTPTGAAIAAEIAEFAPLPALTLNRTGYGIGGRDLADRPNLLRGLLGSVDVIQGLKQDTVTILETHIDDATAEMLGFLLEKLLAAGALDAAYTPLQMKKNRPAVRLTVVARPDDREKLARLVLRESSAIGLRWYDSQRLKLRRQLEQIDTPFGRAQVKLLFDGDELLRIAPEYDSARELAARSGRPFPEVLRVIERTAEKLFGLA